MREAGQSGERFGRDKLGLAPQLHAADDGRQVHIAAAFAGAQQRALNLRRASQNGGPRVGHAQAAIGVAVKSEFDAWVIPHEAADNPGDLLGAGSSGGVADDDPAHLLAGALRGHLVEVVHAALVEVGVAMMAVFTAAAGGIHGVLQVHDHLQAVVLKAVDGFQGHQ